VDKIQRGKGLEDWEGYGGEIGLKWGERRGQPTAGLAELWVKKSRQQNGIRCWGGPAYRKFGITKRVLGRGGEA